MLLSLVAAASASVLFGAAWAPSGLGALAWYDADKLSGTLAGEFDGLLRPPLTGHGGWVGRHDAVLGSVSYVQLTDSRVSDTSAVSSVGGLRLGVGYRRYLHPRVAGAANFYGTAGAFGIVPNAAETDEAYTEDEQADADEAADSARARIGGFGGEAGLGAQYVFGDAQGRPAVAVGVQGVLRGYVGQQPQEGAVRVSTVFGPEVAFVLEFSR